MRLQNWLKKYWVFPVAFAYIIWYIDGKLNLQNDLRKRGKCTIGIVESEIKFTSSQYFNRIEYKVEDSLYVLSTKKLAKVGSHIPIVYDKDLISF